MIHVKLCVSVCVGRHHCWAAGPLGLGLSLYILYPIIINTTTVNYSTWYQTRFRVFLPPPTAAAGGSLPPPQPPPAIAAPGRPYLPSRGRPPSSTATTPELQHPRPPPPSRTPSHGG
jgi:hypothetical protein